MSTRWYPVIDYMVCVECGVCTDFCTHGVYNIGKAPIPVVVNGDGCIEGCHGCGNRCPSGSITYVGDDTGWTPPYAVTSESESCDCGGGCCCGK